MLVAVLAQRPSRWRKWDSIYEFLKRKTRRRHVYTCRDIAKLLQEEDGKEHSPSWVNKRLWSCYLAGKKGIEPLFDSTRKFVGWMRK